MLNLLPNALMNQLVPEATPGTGSPVLGGEDAGLEGSGAFAELLDAQASLADLLEELRELLPEEAFSQLESMAGDGNLLPVAEILAAFRQQISDLAAEQLPAKRLSGSGVAPGSLKISVENPGHQTIALPVAATMPNIAATLNAAAAFDPATMFAIDAASEAKTAPRVNGQAAAALDLRGQLMAALDLDGQSEDLKQKFTSESLRAIEAAVAQTLQREPAGALFRGIPIPEAGTVTPNSTAAGLNLTQPTAVGSIQASLPPVAVPPGEKGWDQSMGERILWMVGRQVQGAEVKITPPHLGPIDIRISVQNDQASVSFAAQHAVVREALEAAIPRLREMLGENNLQLVNVDVNQRGGSEQRTSSDFFQQSTSGEGDSSEGHGLDGESLAEESTHFYRSDGLVDDFA